MTKYTLTIRDAVRNEFTVQEVIDYLESLTHEQKQLPMVTVEPDRIRGRADIDVEVLEDDRHHEYVLLTVSRDPL
jgi:hypothetical protein